MTAFALLNILASGFFYAMANLAMKQFGTQPPLVLYSTVGLAIMTGAYFEVSALSASRLGSSVAIILSVEIVLSFLLAAILLGERFSCSDLAGVLMVVSGIVLLAAKPGEVEIAAQADPADKALPLQMADRAPIERFVPMPND